jgi:hypothetical protein
MPHDAFMREKRIVPGSPLHPKKTAPRSNARMQLLWVIIIHAIINHCEKSDIGQELRLIRIYSLLFYTICGDYCRNSFGYKKEAPQPKDIRDTLGYIYINISLDSEVVEKFD